jgi:hypothetical protein
VHCAEQTCEQSISDCPTAHLIETQKSEDGACKKTETPIILCEKIKTTGEGNPKRFSLGMANFDFTLNAALNQDTFRKERKSSYKTLQGPLSQTRCFKRQNKKIQADDQCNYEDI